MPADPTIETRFTVNGTECAAWLTLPEGSGPHPAVVLVHGLGATHQMMLSQYEQHFAAAGVAVLAFDYRHTGASDGRPRQRITMRRHRQDVHAAINFIKGRPDIDPNRVALWGTSLGGMHVIRVAASRDDLAAAVVQCPIVYGPGAGLSSGIGHVLKLTPVITVDTIRASLGMRRRYIPIVGKPGDLAVVVSPGALEGWHNTVLPGGSFVNQIAAANSLGLVATTATRQARKVKAPLLVCVSDREGLMDPKHVATVARRAPQGTEIHYAADHFEVYHPPILGSILADQTAFLRKYLNV